jgi:cell division protein FtsB
MYRQYQELQDLHAQEEFLRSEIDEMIKQKEELFSTDEKLEKYAREHYYFKKDEEDVFVFE